MFTNCRQILLRCQPQHAGTLPLILSALLGLLGAPGAATAQAATAFGPAVSDAALARVRGGFGLPGGGPIVAFGLQRLVYVDGRLAASDALTVATPASGSGSPSATSAAPTTPDPSASVGLLVQSGSGNTVAAALPAAAAAAVVQNSLNDRHLHVVTVLDVTASSLQAYRSTTLQSTVGAAITSSLRR